MKNLSYTYNWLKGNRSMESKIIEYGIILLHKYKVEQAEVISRLLQYSLFYSQITRAFGQTEHLHFPNISMLTHFHTSFTSLGNIHPSITF